MQLTGQQKYSLCSVRFQMELDGGYSNLPSQVLDKMLSAAQTGVAQLPMWINDDDRTGARSEFIASGQHFAAETNDDDGTIRCTLHFDEVIKDGVTRKVASSIAKSIVRSCITEALVNSVGAQALNDPFARTYGSQLSTRASEEHDPSRAHRTRQYA